MRKKEEITKSYLARRRLGEASAAFLAVGCCVGCVVSCFGNTAQLTTYMIAALWVCVAFWRLCHLNDLDANL